MEAKTKAKQDIALSPAASTERKKARRRRQRINRRQRESDGSPTIVGIGANATRSGITPNPADPRTHNAFAQLGNTASGRAAALKILHPCGEHTTWLTKFPDGASSTSVVMERRDEYRVAWPGDALSSTWTFVMLDLPFIKRSVAVLAYADTTPPPREAIANAFSRMLTQAEDATANVYPKWQLAITDPPTYFTMLRSTTLSPDIWGPGTHAEQSAALGRLVRSARRTCKGVTCDLDAPALADQGRVVSGQWGPAITLATARKTAAQTAADAAATVVVDEWDEYEIELPPVTIEEVVQSDELCYQAEARCGCYQPIRPCQPIVEFTSSSEMRYFHPIVAAPEDTDSAGLGSDLWLRGWSTGVTIFTGLDARAGVRIKTREDLELIPAPRSVYSPFATPGFAHDDRAQAVIREYCRTEPHAYPADFNEADGMAKQLVHTIGDVVSNLGIPVLSGLAQPLSRFLGGLFG